MGVAQVHLESALRERPLTTLLVTAGGAALLGFALGRRLASKPAAQPEAPASSTDRARQLVQENGGFDSGTSTPRFSGTGATPRSSGSGDFGERLDVSMALVYRADLPTGQGRLATLCAHATLGQFKKLWRAKSEDLKLWERTGAVKFCLQVADEAQLQQIERAAQALGLPTHTVKDVQQGQRVRCVMALGPAQSSRIREATRDLKLLS